MSVGFKKYLPVWAILLALINATAWIMPLIRSKAFWTVYWIINACWFIQLLIAYFAFKEKKEVSSPIIFTSFTGLIVLFIVDAVGLYYFWEPWVLALISFIIAVINYILIVLFEQNQNKALVRDEHVKEATETMNSFTKEVKALYDTTNNEDIYKLYEVLKYSDKASKDPKIENQIRKDINLLKDNISPEELKNKIDQIIDLIKSR